MEEKLNKLKMVMGEISDLGEASAVLGWDQETYMPTGGAEARGQIQATLGRLIHERITSDESGKLLEELVEWSKAELDPDSDDARMIKVAKRGYDRQTKMPVEMVEEQAKLQSAGNIAWREAREKDDFEIFRPHLEHWVDFVQRFADLFKPYEHVYDTLLDIYEPEMKTSEVRQIFADLRPKQVELIEAIKAQPEVDDSLLHQKMDKDTQMKMGAEIVSAFGYDFQRGRQDIVHHPFATNLGWGDQRITVRVYEDFLNPYIFGAMHEAGHAMYEQGIPKSMWRTSLYGGTSLSIHESQSRMWENLVGRSRPFWEWFFPRLQEYFPSQFKNATVDQFYRSINKVAPSLIRVEADEATYNLHIMLRMEIEIEMLEGSLAVIDLPEVWNTRFQDYLGITPPNNTQGCLQDVHWSFGLYGYFATYALGNLVSVQLWEKIKEAHPDLDDQIRKGEFKTLLTWLNKNVHESGSKFEPQELVQKITGSKINGDPYINYLNTKYGEIYGL